MNLRTFLGSVTISPLLFLVNKGLLKPKTDVLLYQIESPYYELEEKKYRLQRDKYMFWENQRSPNAMLIHTNKKSEQGFFTRDEVKYIFENYRDMLWRNIILEIKMDEKIVSI